jgi:hypothetical protein
MKSTPIPLVEIIPVKALPIALELLAVRAVA